eukprot:1308413-Pleurochrysis_carterae.AAC.1
MRIDEARLAQTFTMSASGERSFTQSHSAQAQRRNRSVIELADQKQQPAEAAASSHQRHAID